MARLLNIEQCCVDVPISKWDLNGIDWSGNKPNLHSTHHLNYSAQAIAISALKSSLKTAKRLQLDQTKTAKDQTCSLGLSVLRLEDCKKTGCGVLVLFVKTGLLYPSNDPSKHT